MELSFKLQALPGKTSVLSPAYPTCITTCACNATPSLHRYAEVESICGRAVLLHQQLNTPPSSKPVLVAKTMRALALVLLGRAAEAEPLAVSCLEAVHSMPGPPAERSSFLASCHNCHAEVLRELGRLNDAETAAREGLALREKVWVELGARGRDGILVVSGPLTRDFHSHACVLCICACMFGRVYMVCACGMYHLHKVCLLGLCVPSLACHAADGLCCAYDGPASLCPLYTSDPAH